MEINPLGGMAQLGARLTGSQKVRGSNPLISTKMMKGRDGMTNAVFFDGNVILAMTSVWE